ncbi:glycosylated lysosomal membrane protein [Cynoglossus semilaevis]|uniref:glycosylated lysosomal membrane protein n=1 Tax=Cynoglossus semilaevis TaxID=244447 RepID=UPI000497F5D0|nr:glycosylated lysosomal membrane protein [Cynoglossus semilaevis]
MFFYSEFQRNGQVTSRKSCDPRLSVLVKMAAAVSVRVGSLFFLVLLSVPSPCSSSSERTLFLQLNPGALSPPAGGDLLHARAVGDNDTLHFLFCSLGAPTLLILHTNTTTSTVQVNWTLFLARNTSGSLKVEPENSLLSSTAVVFTKLLEYDDANDTADPTSDLFPEYRLQDFTWSRLHLSGPVALLCGSAPNTSDGWFCLKLSVFDSEGRGQQWPRLLHTANSTQLELWLHGFSPRSAQSRFLVELQSVGGAYPLNKVNVRRSIDDEFTPSIFQMSEWVSSVNSTPDVPWFVQWRPVAYRNSSRSLEDATACRSSAPRPHSGNQTASASALIQGFYSNPETFGLNVSFGAAGDPFFNSTRFLSWTLLVGVGSPPVDSFSPLVVTIMAVGLGAPLLLLLVGGVWVCVRRTTSVSTASTYQPIN